MRRVKALEYILGQAVNTVNPLTWTVLATEMIVQPDGWGDVERIKQRAVYSSLLPRQLACC